MLYYTIVVRKRKIFQFIWSDRPISFLFCRRRGLFCFRKRSLRKIKQNEPEAKQTQDIGLSDQINIIFQPLVIKTDITSLVQPGIAILSSVLFGTNCLLRHNFMTLLSGLAETFFVLMRNNIRTSFYFITKSDSVIYTRSFEGFWSCLPRLLDKPPIYFPCWFSGGKNK